MLTSSPQSGKSGQPGVICYTVEHRGNCVLVFGAIPITAFSALVKLAPKKAIMDTQLSRVAGCSLAMGLIEDTKALRASMSDAALGRARAIYAATSLSAEAVRWLAVGERGASSDAMFFKLSGVRPQDMIGGASSHPRDPDDLSRCRLLLEQVPELAARFGDMKTISHIWESLVLRWDEICHAMDEESPEWRAGKGKSSKTYVLMKACSTED